jgi:Ca-activated chloride channel family protein
MVDGGAVLGYGTPEGGQMKVRALDVPDEEAELIVDSTGAPAVSKLDEKTLRQIAEELDVQYVHRFTADPVDDLVAGVDLATIVGDGRRTQIATRPVVWPIAWFVIGLVAWEAFALSGLLRRGRQGGL